MAIKLYIGPSLAYSVTPHANPPTFNEAIHNASLNVQGPFIHPVSRKRYVNVQITVSSCGDDASDVRVRLYASTASADKADPANIDIFVMAMMAGTAQAQWLGQTILTPTWTSSTVPYILPNTTNPICILAAKVSCPNMTPAGPTLLTPTQDQCVGIYVKATGNGATAALSEGSNTSGIGVATSLGLLGLNWIIDRRDRLRNESSYSAGILIDPKKRNRK